MAILVFLGVWLGLGYFYMGLAYIYIAVKGVYGDYAEAKAEEKVREADLELRRF